MTKKTKLFITLTVLTTIAGAASAQTDSLRCEARQMRADSQYHRCLSRCDRRVERNAARPADRQTDINPADCETACATHHDDDLARINGKAPCIDAPPPTPRPEVCEALMLRLSSSQLMCAAQCGRQHRRDGFDTAACFDTCQTRCGTAADQLMASPVCADGRVGSGDVCALH
jgi:hypothetical protein